MTFREHIIDFKWQFKWRLNRLRRWLKPDGQQVKLTIGQFDGLQPTKDFGIHRITTRSWNGKVKVILATSRPGLVIGRLGSNIQALQQELQRALKKEVHVHLVEFNPFDYH